MNIKSIVFADGESIYKDLAKKYIRHKTGLFILAPSGSGKTHFCNNQSENHWIDGDELWIKAGAHPDGPWWNEGLEVINRIDGRSDVITMEAKYEGFWIMGASNRWLKPDAIVIPDWETHKKYIEHRHLNNYDGGATPEDHEQVKSHIAVIKKWHDDFGVPMFKNIEDAVESLVNSIAA